MGTCTHVFLICNENLLFLFRRVLSSRFGVFLFLARRALLVGTACGWTSVCLFLSSQSTICLRENTVRLHTCSFYIKWCAWWLCAIRLWVVDVLCVHGDVAFLLFTTLFVGAKTAFYAILARILVVFKRIFAKKDKKNRICVLFFQILLSLCIVNLKNRKYYEGTYRKNRRDLCCFCSRCCSSG